MEFEEMVRFAVENGASDIHLASNNLPSYRKNGKIMNYKGTEILDEDTVMQYIDEVLSLPITLSSATQAISTRLISLKTSHDSELMHSSSATVRRL